MSIEAQLHTLGLVLPTPAKPVASYVPTVRTGALVFVSGQLPFANGQLVAQGAVPRDLDAEAAKDCARQCVLNGLAALQAEIGDLAKLRRVVRIGVFVQSIDGFTGQPQIANGASDLLVQLLGDAGKHARTSVSVNALPLNAPVEIEFVFEVTGE
ncbi:MAG: RidA family protein [Planctomycetota bacterium]|nr:MAG: RidA family protein [Planctomycetota bacterium]